MKFFITSRPEFHSSAHHEENKGTHGNCMCDEPGIVMSISAQLLTMLQESLTYYVALTNWAQLCWGSFDKLGPVVLGHFIDTLPQEIFLT